MSKYVVIDLEMCKVPKNNRCCRYQYANETIQIGAVLLDDSFEKVGEFNTYVRPEFGFVDWYISNLTGITTKDVAKAPNMSEALNAFLNWVPNDAVVVSWSTSDRDQIQHEVTSKGLQNEKLESIYDRWQDCQAMFSERLSEKRCYKLSEALIISDIEQEGKEHDGLMDAYNTAKLYAKLLREPELKLNTYFEKSRCDESEHLNFSMGDLFKRLSVQFA